MSERVSFCSAIPPGIERGRAGEIVRAGALELARAVREGAWDAVEVMRACLARIEEVDGEVQAWAHLDPAYALALAEAADEKRRGGLGLGPLHGVPVAVKDIFDTADYPTEDGTVLHAGRSPGHDATAVARLRSAGAIVVGKSVTTELAMYAPGKTRNPYDPARTPGGSSSGSAAAVASWMVPLGLGSQTNGSVIRPAAFCGVVGYKPTHGLISRHRVLALSRALDHVGVFARTVEDAALMAECLIGFDEQDPDTRLRPAPALLAAAREEPPSPPRFGFVDPPHSEQAEASTHEAFGELRGALGDQAQAAALPGGFDDVVERHRIVMEADLARSLARERARGADHLSPVLREMLERGTRVTAVDYNDAVARAGELNGLLGGLFERFDAIVVPATAGEAPVGLQSTGSPVFCTPWTFCGTPAVTLPLMTGPAGLPLGVQLVGPRGDDARLLRTARWLVRALAEAKGR